MFASLFTFVFEFLFGVGAIAIVYEVLLSDWLLGRKNLKVQKSEAISSADKIAQVKLVSQDDKDIEKFITNNAQYLSSEIVTKLVDRIEAIRTDQYINDDTLLKTRIDALAPVEEIEYHAPKKASRRR